MLRQMVRRFNTLESPTGRIAQRSRAGRLNCTGRRQPEAVRAKKRHNVAISCTG
jgi:hypothetical protein